MQLYYSFIMDELRSYNLFIMIFKVAFLCRDLLGDGQIRSQFMSVKCGTIFGASWRV